MIPNTIVIKSPNDIPNTTLIEPVELEEIMLLSFFLMC